MISDDTFFSKINDYCLGKTGAYESRPFGEYPICYRIMGKIFAQFNPEKDFFKITLKCDPELAMNYRMMFPNVVVRGYHCPPVQQPYWNTIDLDNFTDKDILLKMIDEAYDTVADSLTHKAQYRLSELEEASFVNTEGSNQDFINLCMELDNDLNEIVGGHKQRECYDKYNKLDSIHDVIIAYYDGAAAACGSFKMYDDEHAEIKRIYTRHEYRAKGLAAEILRRLEAQAKMKGFKYCILETGSVLEAACHMYKRAGYDKIMNYGQYADMPESICMSKKI